MSSTLIRNLASATSVTDTDAVVVDGSHVGTKKFLLSSLWNWLMSKTYVFSQGTQTIPEAINELNSIISSSVSGTPVSAQTVSDMTDTSKIYIYTGNESGYVSGNWYYYNGSSWISGGAYGTSHIDETLSISGAAADSKTVGDTINEISQSTKNLWLNGDVSIGESGYVQMLLKKPLEAGTYTISCECSSTWTGSYSLIRFSRSQNASSMSGDSFITECQIANDGTRDYAIFVLSETAYSIRFLSGTTISGGGGYTSEWDNIQIETGSASTRYIKPNSAIDRFALRAINYIITSDNIASTYSDTDDFPPNTIIGVNSGAISELDNYPTSYGGEVITYSHDANGAVLQMCFPFSPANDSKIYMRTRVNSTWGSWNGIETSSSYIGYDLYPTGDTTNRASEINAILSVKGTCRLAPGDYYVSVLVVYEGSEIIGCGKSTRIIRIGSSSYNYMIRLRTDCRLHDVSLIGSLTDIGVNSNWDLWGTTPGICGIRIEGTGTSDEQRFRVEVSNVRISGFAGAGIFVSKTGYNPQGGCHFDNIFVRNCNAGIVFDFFAEFHRVTGCGFFECYYGAVNNGANNVFTNCDFSSNMQGILMEDDINDYSNNSHGAFVGCTFNHSGNNSGVAIGITGMVAGEMFTGCSIFYGSINITDSQGIVFDSCNFGSDTPISITNGGGIVFNSCIFRTNESVSTIVGNTGTHFNNCYYLNNGNPVVGSYDMPITVSSSSDMSNTSKKYLYIGSESGYTPGNWYYHDGSSWKVGGKYGVIGSDTTLSVAGVAADSKSTGDAIQKSNDEIDNINSSVFTTKDISSQDGSTGSGTSNGVTWTKNAQNDWTATGTANSSGSNRTLIGSTSSFPNRFYRGQKLIFNITTTDPGIRLNMYCNRSGGSTYSVYMTETTTVKIPDDATSVLIRLRISANIQVSGTITFSISGIYNAKIKPTGDTTDITDDIVRALTYCGNAQLDAGVYYVSGIDMPDASSINGVGKNTVLRLINSDETTEVYAIKPGRECTISNLSIIGADEDITLPESIGKRTGIRFEADTDIPASDLNVTNSTVRNNVNNIHISRMTGSGIYCNRTGYSYHANANWNNLWIWNCFAGLNIDWWSEYHHFSTFSIDNCYYGIINNGGNNMFSCGCISGNTIGFILDNSNGDKNNNGHGSMSCCNINHTNNDIGYGVIIRGTASGFIFSGCRIHYSRVEITSSGGIVFDHCGFRGGDTINITGGATVLFDGCTSSTSGGATQPNITTNNNYTYLANCYKNAGGAWTITNT